MMDRYVTGAVIRRLRENKHMTQEKLAEKLFVSSKTISKWETGHGFPDISLLEALAKELDISVIELLSGEHIRNRNRSYHIGKGKLYVCPVCGNVIQSSGEAVVSCCGITLPPLEAEPCDPEHEIRVERVENEYFVSAEHPMTKDHYLSFFAAVSDHGIQFEKLYPEGNPETRFRIDRIDAVYAYCNRHGLFRVKPGKTR